jgi:hypothetical protein
MMDTDGEHDDAPVDAKAQALAEDDRKFAKIYFGRLSTLNGYAETFSLFAGETLKLRLALKPAVLGLRLKRSPTVLDVAIRDAVSGKTVATFTPDAKISLETQVPAGYRDDGAAYRTLVEIDTTGWPAGVLECVVRDSSGNVSRDIFVNIKPHSFDGYDIVCVLPFITWQAYNYVGGACFYAKSLGPVRTISTQRPLHRRGDNALDASLAFLHAFASDGVKWACIDSADLHHATLPKGRAPVMALLTHDEYWSKEMRDQVSLYLRRRGVLMVAAGNVCWWMIDIDGPNLTVNKNPRPEAAYWWTRVPEEKTFLASFRFGGYALAHAKNKWFLVKRVEHLSDAELHEAGAITVVKTDHPLFEGVALGPGNTFGAEVPIVYREVDGIPLKPDGSVDRDWYDADEIEPEIIATGLTVNNNRFHPIARIGVVMEADVRRGHVLHLGSFGWSRGLTQKNEAVKRIVLNAYHHCRSFARERKRRGQEEE